MVLQKTKKKIFFKYIFTTVKILFVITLILIFATVGIVSGSLVGFIKSTSLLTDKELKITEFTSTIYDNRNNEITKLDTSINREWIPYDSIQDEIKNAFIAIEDRRFYKHNGIDFEGTMRAIYKKITKPNSIPEGASTITMQLVRNLTDERDVNITRKLKEQWRAIQLEKKLTKKEILESYLNIVFLGHRYYGIKTASMRYFNKDISNTKLTLAEAACLASITQSPSYYDPLTKKGAKNVLTKQKVVLFYMYEMGTITKEAYEDALKEKVQFVEGSNIAKSNQSYFVDAVIKQVVDDCKKLGMQEQLVKSSIYNNGWKIYTTMDPDMQAAMDAVFTNPDYFPLLGRNDEYGNPYNPQAAMVLLDQHTGDVKALYGGYGPKELSNSLNRATSIPRGAGSTFKPIGIYAPGLQMGAISPGSVIDDVPVYLMPKEPDTRYPKNFGDSYHGLTKLRDGIKYSYNVVAADVWNRLDKTQVWQLLGKSGFPRPKEYTGVGVALGSSPTSPLQIAGAYTPLANKGVYIEPTLYTKVVKNDGTVLIDKKAGVAKQEQNTVYDEGVAYCITNLLRSVIEEGTGSAFKVRNANGQRITASGKTGTNEGTDLWFAGYTPYYLGAVWFGDEANKEMPRISTNPSGRIWQAVMNEVHKNLEPKYYDRPDNVIYKNYCEYSGKTPTRNCMHGTYSELFIRGISPEDYCDVHLSGADGIRVYREKLKAVKPRDMHFIIGQSGLVNARPSPSPTPTQSRMPVILPMITPTINPSTTPTQSNTQEGFDRWRHGLSTQTMYR